jgi:hypothetical protein
MTLAEADSPDQGFHQISNKLAGRIESPVSPPEVSVEAGSQ